MRTSRMTLLFLVLFSIRAFPQEKGGEDETGPYELVANWPLPVCGDGYQWGSVGGGLQMGRGGWSVGGNSGYGLCVSARLLAGAPSVQQHRARSQCVGVFAGFGEAGSISSLGSRLDGL